jgi:KDO2-lipid IV(A) lauroyltransferase
MARKKPAWQIRFEYYPIKGLFRLLGILPWSLSLLVSQSLLCGIWVCLRKRQQITDDNLSQAFPELDRNARQRIAEAAISNLSRGITVFAKLPHLRQEEWADLVRIEGLEHVQSALSQGRGVLAFTAHYGCWEAMSLYLSRLVPTSIVVRPLDNPRLDALVSGVRASGGIKIIPKRRALIEGLRTLRENRLLGILIDQNFASGGSYIRFMDRPTASTPIVSLLARKSGCPVLPLHSVWENGRLRVIFEPPIRLSQEADRALAVAADTQAMNAVVEGWIRKVPGQWLWLHNRWKRQPEPDDLVYSPEQRCLVRWEAVVADERTVARDWAPQRNLGEMSQQT